MFSNRAANKKNKKHKFVLFRNPTLLRRLHVLACCFPAAGLTTNTVFVFCTVIFCTVTVFKTVTVNSICSLKILCYQKTVTVKQKFGWQQKSKKYL